MSTSQLVHGADLESSAQQETASWSELLDGFESQLDQIASALDQTDPDELAAALDQVSDLLWSEQVMPVPEREHVRARSLLARQEVLVRRLQTALDGIRLELAQLHGQSRRHESMAAPRLAAFIDVAG